MGQDMEVTRDQSTSSLLGGSMMVAVVVSSSSALGTTCKTTAAKKIQKITQLKASPAKSNISPVTKL